MIDHITQTPESIKLVADTVAVVSWISVLTGVITPLVGFFAAVASLIWGCLRIWETRTVQQWVRRHPPHRERDE